MITKKIDWGKNFPITNLDLDRDDIPAFFVSVENAAWDVLESYGYERQVKPLVLAEGPPPFMDAVIACQLLAHSYFGRNHFNKGRISDAIYNVSRIKDLLHESDRISKSQLQKSKKRWSENEGDKRTQERRVIWDTWQIQANVIWAEHPEWSKERVAKKIKQDIKINDKQGTIAKRLKKPT